MTNNPSSGNAVIIVLVTIALFAALIFAFTRSSQQSGGNLTKQQAKLAAQDIIAYAQAIEGAVNRVRMNGCSENQISFDYDIPGATGYENTNSPSDEKCHVFSEKGGKAKFQTLSPTYKETGHSENWSYMIIQQGTDSERDLVIVAPFISEIVCTELNTALGRTTTPQDNGDMAVVGYFTGSYIVNNSVGNAGFRDFKTTCVKTSATASIGPNTFHFFHTLLER